jgi:protein-S-isoprenylcysteine O-methyltransferase Ste14
MTEQSASYGPGERPFEFDIRHPLRSIELNKFAYLDIAERVFVTLMFAYFANNMLIAFAQTFNLVAIFSITAEMLCIILIIIRAPSKQITGKMSDWIIAFAGASAPLLAMPADVPSIAPQQLCITLILFGMFTQICAKVILWKSFGIVAANRGVKIEGPYRVVRHPMYLGYVITHVGIFLTFPTVYNALIYVSALVVQIVRLMREEQVLLRDPAYEAYAGKVRYRLLPGVF